MRILFDSKKAEFKTPFGCLCPGEGCTLHVHIPSAVGTRRAELVLCYEDGSPARYLEMFRREQRGDYDIYEGEFSLFAPGLYFYYFQIHGMHGMFRLFKQGDDTNMEEGGLWQVSCVSPDFTTPDWAKGAVIYQIFPDRFHRTGSCDLTGKLQPYTIHRRWSEDVDWAPDENGIIQNNDFFGGNFRGITDKLDYIAGLGVTLIYLNPICKAFSNHRYDTGDYKTPDPMLGTEADFARLCSAAHVRGIRVILDGVFSHTGSNSLYFDRNRTFGGMGAYCRQDSPYYNWYTFYHWPDNYHAWWNFDTLPTVNKMHPDFIKYIITDDDSVLAHWLRLGADGFRLDVADELPDEFIRMLHDRLRQLKPDGLLMGEVWEDATTKFGFDKRRTYLLGKGLDSVMNYPFKNAVLGFVCGRDAGQTMTDILSICEHYPAPALDTALNFLSTHDTERALTVIADEPANGRGREWQSGRCVTGDAYEEGMLKLRMAYAIIYTLPGVPCLYYGDEIGMQGYRDPFNRGFYCWDSHEERLKPVLAQLAQLRHTCEAFRTGELRVLRAEGGVLHYQRIGEFEAAEIIVNRTEHIIVEPLASGKHTEVNPMGFTIVVEEVGHNPNHSYYDYK